MLLSIACVLKGFVICGSNGSSSSVLCVIPASPECAFSISSANASAHLPSSEPPNSAASSPAYLVLTFMKLAGSEAGSEGEPSALSSNSRSWSRGQEPEAISLRKRAYRRG